MNVSQKYIIGIDLGTQSAKVILFNTAGETCLEASHPLQPLNIPKPQHAEHPDDDLWDSLKRACQKLMVQFSGDPQNILGIGLCTIRCCRVLLKGDGRLSYPVINWMDQRLGEAYEYEARYGDVEYVTTTSGYITHRLTGEFKDTAANYIGAWPIDNEKADWSESPEQFKQNNLTRKQLFELVKPGEILGHITQSASKQTGLPTGIPVIATAHDKAVEMLGAGLIDSSKAQISLGTYIGAFIPSSNYTAQAKNFWCFQSSVPKLFMNECMGVRRGMWTISWFLEEFYQDPSLSYKEKLQKLNEAAASIHPGSEGLLTIHDWAPPSEAPYRRGVFLGFDGRHTKHHIYRSIIEGIALTLSNNVLPMLEEMHTSVETFIVTGGGASSDVFMQILADVFNITTQRVNTPSCAATGAFLNAAVALGIHNNYQEATKTSVSYSDKFCPNSKNHSFYKKLNSTVYKDLHKYTDAPLKELMNLLEI